MMKIMDRKSDTPDIFQGISETHFCGFETPAVV